MLFNARVDFVLRFANHLLESLMSPNQANLCLSEDTTGLMFEFTRSAPLALLPMETTIMIRFECWFVVAELLVSGI